MRALGVAALCVVLGGCAWIQRGVARTSEVIPVSEKVVARHDVYVRSDETLTDLQITNAVEDSRRLMEFLRTRELADIDQLAAFQAAVLARHDAYVAADGELSDTQKARYLRSTTIMRKLAVIEGDGD